MSVRAVLFDAAGTLFRVRGSVGAAYAAVAARHGVSAGADDIEGRFRSAFRGMPPMCFPGVPAEAIATHERAWWRQVVTAAFTGFQFDDFEAFFSELFDYFARADSWELFADVWPTLTRLRARHMQLAIVSNFDSRLTQICEGLKIATFFETIIMSSQVGCAKPDLTILRIALDRLGVSPGAAVHVGDSEALDVKGAEAAGVRAVLIQRGPHASQSDNRHIRDLSEVLAWL